MQSRTIERLAAFTDGTVAIALTLLVLPLVDTAREVAVTPVGTLLGEHVRDFFAFVLSFFVVALFWRIHHRLFDLVERLDDAVLILNTCWLLGVVFLPVPTAVLIYEKGSPSGATVLYLANMFFVSAVGLLLTLWIRGHPELQRPGAGPALSDGIRRGALACVWMAVGTALAVPLGPGALWLLLGLGVAQRVTARRARPH